MITRDEVVSEARTWLDTPWVASGAVKGTGCNCLGFLAGVARNCGLEGVWRAFRPHEGFALPPDASALLRGLRAHLMPVKPAEARPADVLLFNRGGLRHVALMTDPGWIIHADQRKGRVVEHRMIWTPHSAYTVPGVY